METFASVICFLWSSRGFKLKIKNAIKCMSVGKQDALIITCYNFFIIFLGGGGRKSKNNCFNRGVQDTELI